MGRREEREIGKEGREKGSLGEAKGERCISEGRK